MSIHHAADLPHQRQAPINDGEEAIPHDLPRVRTWGVIIAMIVALAAFAGLFLLGWIPRQHRLALLHKETVEMIDMQPRVQVTTPQRSAATIQVKLPANIAAWQQTAIFPQASGYLVKQLVDIGDSVKAGQLLAVISSPEIDAQLSQAKADVAQAQAILDRDQDNQRLAQTTLNRYQGFFKSGGITQQQLDQYQSTATTAQASLAAALASVQAAHANVQRLSALQGYEKVVAPFAGVITARNYNLGALMSSTNTAPGRELFDIADTSVLRVYVDVDQMYVTSAKVGDAAAVEVRNYPGRDFPGSITRTSSTVDPTTRKMRYEIDVPNKSGLLYPGMYAQAVLTIKRSDRSILIPTGALVFDAEGTRVWVVDHGKVYSKKVSVGRDMGTNIEILGGLTGDEHIITNPGDRLSNGMQVDVVNPPALASSAPHESAPQ